MIEMKTSFLTQNEVARQAGVPASRITSAIEAGILTPAGRAGNHKHAPVVFLESELENIIATLQATGRVKASATTRPPHRCRNTADIIQKGEALIRAKREGAK
jgi:hypothetical protein